MVSREPIRYSVVFVVWVSQLDVKVYDEHLLVCNFFYFFSIIIYIGVGVSVGVL